MQIEFAELSFEGRNLRLEYTWLNADRADAPLIVFMHEGLGSLAMWGGFPQRLCDAGGFRGLLYSRYGYGRSTAWPAREQWPLDYLEREARQLLPDFLRAVGADARPWLFGHSDGASIGRIHAAAHPNELGGAVVLAPHIFVEEATIAGIAAARRSYETSDLRKRLARRHADPEDVLALARPLDRSVVPHLEHRNAADEHPMCGACDPRRGRRVRDHGATRRHQATAAAGRTPEARRLPARTPSRSAEAGDRCGHSVHRQRCPLTSI
jgi:pimeloyl-ACP methyl ester carboxylesterase